MSGPREPIYKWIARPGSNLDNDLIKNSAKRVSLDSDDFHPLQKQELESTSKGIIK